MSKTMLDPYGKVKRWRLTFKGGDLATRTKSIDKKYKKKKNKLDKSSDEAAGEEILSGEASEAVAPEKVVVEGSMAAAAGEGRNIYTIDAAKRKKYDGLFLVEARKFGYDPKANVKSVEEALDDRVKKKADRYCK